MSLLRSISVAIAAVVLAGGSGLSIVAPVKSGISLVTPGANWLTDAAEHYLFLTLTIPETLPLEDCKVLTNGQALLVVVTQRPEIEPETEALKKFRMFMEAIKVETGHDENALKSKLQEWSEEEEDVEVQVRVRAALDSLTQVQAVKQHQTSHGAAVAVPLGLPKSHGGRLPGSSFLQLQRGVQRSGVARSSIIPESFSIEVPFPVESKEIFVVRSKPTELVVGMPLKRSTPEAKLGLATAAQAFERVPVFGQKGEKLAGFSAAISPNIAQLASGLDLASLAGQGTYLKPLDV